MSSLRKYFLCELTFFLLLCLFVVNSDGEERIQEEKDIEKVKFNSEVPLNQQNVTLQGIEQGNALTVSVVLQQTDRFTKPVRYQLRSVDSSIKYCHEVSLRFGGVGWKLFTQGPGTNYLAWISHVELGIMDVSTLIASIIDKPLTLRLSRFLEPKYLESTLSRSAIHPDIEIVSVKKNDNGILRIEIRDPNNDKMFYFTFDGKTWHGYTSDNVELSPK